MSEPQIDPLDARIDADIAATHLAALALAEVNHRSRAKAIALAVADALVRTLGPAGAILAAAALPGPVGLLAAVGVNAMASTIGRALETGVIHVSPADLDALAKDGGALLGAAAAKSGGPVAGDAVAAAIAAAAKAAGAS